MKEIKSPNVKKIIPLSIPQEVDSRYNPDNYMIVDHGSGIFEFQYRGPVNRQYLGMSILNDFNTHEEAGCMYNVDVTGIKEDEGVGSQRFCTMNKPLAEFLNKVILDRGVIDLIPNHEAIAVSKYFRFMKYNNGGEHYPHYDSDFLLNATTATKYSLVMYFTDCDSGEFAFVNDTRENHNNTDWDRQATPEEIEIKITPKALKILIFPHTLCHTVLPFTDGEKKQRIICRGDIYFQEITNAI